MITYLGDVVHQQCWTYSVDIKSLNSSWLPQHILDIYCLLASTSL